MEEKQVHKYLEIAERIRQDIVSGVYAVGEKIPPIRRLSESYGVNPQTVNKATAYLASLGYLNPRQGSGSVVTLPRSNAPARYTGMLVDRTRSEWLSHPESAENSHSKDIYFTYLMLMNSERISASFVVYDTDAEEVAPDFAEQALNASGFLVQGNLPRCYFEFLASRMIPTVLINRTLPEGIEGRFGSVQIAEEKLNDLVNYLMSMGHTRLLFVFSSELERNEVFMRRFREARAAMEGWGGSEACELREFCFHVDDPEAPARLRGLLDEGFTAAVGYNDVSALRLYSLLGSAGKSIPEDFSVVGFDDILAASLAHPPLTTVRVNRQELVREACAMLTRLQEAGQPLLLESELHTELILRKSVFVRRRDN